MKIWMKIILLVTFLAIGVFVLLYQWGERNSLLQPVSLIQNFYTQFPTKSKTSSKSLERVVMEGITQSGDFGIVVKNLSTGKSYEKNSHQVFEAASLYKLWVMATLFQQLKEETLEKDDILKGDIADLNEMFHISSVSAELTEGEIQMSVGKALEKMIATSDNYAALLLSSKIRNSNVTKFLAEFEFDESSLGIPPQTTAYDIALFYEKLYKGEIVDKLSSTEMVDLLKKQQLNDRIPKYLAEDVQVAHKTGEFGFIKHDSGIVFSASGDYIIVVLSKTKSPKQAAEQIAIMSKRVYDYFSEL